MGNKLNEVKRISQMGYATSVFFLLLCAPSLTTSLSKPLPSVYVQMDLKFPWSELCLLETYVKTKLSEMLIKDDGTSIMLSQIYLNNFDESCQSPKKNTEEASLLFYVIKPGGNYDDVDEEMTKEAFRILYYLAENSLGQLLGPLFERKIKNVQAKGSNAPPKPSGFSETERTYIALGIAVGVVATILLLTIAVYYCKESRRPASKSSGSHNEEVEIVDSPPSKAHVDAREPPSGVSETKF
ncbi:uncharacterized protein [Montipora foliosa]|uniref:uncharacterized protein n=1 Tax=Montipora foliosa TaxID=591990 RepID=UPI0035F107C9